MLCLNLPRVFLATLSAFFIPLLHAAQPIVGAWPLGDGSEEGSGLVIFYPNGYYVHIEDVESGEDPDGMEKGVYIWNETTGVLGAVPIIDTNGEAGLSHMREEEQLRFRVNGDTLTLSGLEGETPIETQFQRNVETPNSILGTWIAGDVASKNQIAVNFFDNGFFVFGEEIDEEEEDEEGAVTGIERGTYTWDSGTGAFTGNVILDTNGPFGVSSLDGLSVTFTVVEDTLTISVEGEDDESIFSRPSSVAEVEVDRNFDGGWFTGLASVLSFADDGTYYGSTQIGSSENPLTGMERGTFTLDADTFRFTASAVVDTNGEAGMAGTGLDAKMAVHNDTMYRWRSDGSLFTYARIKGESNDLLGSWQFGERGTEDSGVVSFFDNELLENKTVSGFYVIAEDVEPGDESVSDGVELGLYTIDARTNHLAMTSQLIDTNGDAGFSGFGPNTNIRIWALGDSLVLADQASEGGGFELLELSRVSETPPEVPEIVFDKLTVDQWLVMYRGALQSSADLAFWADVETQPGSPWYPSTSELEAFYRSGVE